MQRKLMRISRFKVLLLSIIFLIMNNGCSSKKFSGSNIVAKYDNDKVVTIDELNKYVKDWMYFKKYRTGKDIYNNALNDLLVNQLKRMDFFDKGLDKDRKLIQSINRIINEELVAEYFETQYLGKYLTEENAKKIYGMMNKEVIYQLIELSKPEDASPKQLDSLKEKALTLKSEIDNGKEFSSLVKEYSQNKISLMNNGYMPPVDWKQSILNPVSNVIFHLNKNDVRILNSDVAFLIVKIANIKTIQVEPFDSIKSNILSELKKVYANSSFDEYHKDKKDLINENSLQWNETALEQIVQWSNIPNFYKSEYEKTFKNALENGNNKIILTYNGGTVDYKEFLRLLENVLIIRDFQGMKEEDIKKYTLEALRTDLIVKKAEALDLRKNIFNAFTINPSLKSKILYLYNQAEIELKLPEATDEALHRFFKENENTIYYQLEKRNLFVMVFPTDEDAEKALGKINNGIPFEKVTGSYLVKTYIKERSGEIKSYSKDEKPTFGKVGFEMKESEVSGPVIFEDENSQSKYAVIKCHHIRPEKQLTYDDVKNTITEDFKNYYRKKIDEEIEKRLKNKYKPVINEKVLEKIISVE
jgi:hypothetical protein